MINRKEYKKTLLYATRNLHRALRNLVKSIKLELYKIFKQKPNKLYEKMGLDKDGFSILVCEGQKKSKPLTEYQAKVVEDFKKFAKAGYDIDRAYNLKYLEERYEKKGSRKIPKRPFLKK